jgi:hypothetical protein
LTQTPLGDLAIVNLLGRPVSEAVHIGRSPSSWGSRFYVRADVGISLM